VTAVVGPSGSGKTTLLRLLAGLERPTAGGFEIGGRRADRLSLAEHRALVSVVWQEGGLVRGSLWRNLTLAAAPPPSRREVDRVVDLCGLRAVVAGLDEGYDAEVAEAGGSLSAGQQQRLSLARALLRDAPLLLLDEATAHLDVDTETAILAPLLDDCRRRGRTLVYVTHRPATAALADRVVRLAGGRLVAVEGTAPRSAPRAVGEAR
jgi:ABC-type bacteriocin/lantibiotic exporter with double-glycine peptidase domain